MRISDLVRDERGVAIVRALRHRSYGTRYDAEQEVARWPVNLASAVIGLDHRRPVVRLQAAEQLASAPTDHYAVRAGLQLGARDKHPPVAIVCGNALLQARDVAGLWPLLEFPQFTDDSNVGEFAARTARCLDDGVVDQLLAKKCASSEGDWQLGFVLKAMAPRVGSRLAERCADRAGYVRRRALHALGASGDPSLADAARAHLEDRRPADRYAALSALEGLGVGLPQVLDFLNDRRADMRRSAASLIGAARIEGGYEALVARLSRERDESVRATIVEALAAIGGQDAIPLLTATLSEGTGAEHYRFPASASRAAASALRELGQPGTEVLLEKASDPDVVVRRAVLGEIGGLPRDHRVARVLADALRDDDLEVTATDAFFGSSGPVPESNWYSLWHKTPVQATQDVLLPMLDDPDSVIRIRACRALMSQEVPHVAERVRRLFVEDTDPEVRGQALRTLAAINAPGLRELTTPLLEKGDPPLAEHAKWAVEHADLVASVHREQGRDPWATAWPGPFERRRFWWQSLLQRCLLRVEPRTRGRRRRYAHRRRHGPRR
jgi:HEAT repeat protein